MIKFGDAIRRFREHRQYSLRDLSKLTDIDHAYIHRLENGEKAAPSAQVLNALFKALKLDTRHKDLLEALLEVGEVPDALFETMLRNPKYTVDAFRIAPSMSYRGARPVSVEDWEKQLDFIDGLLKNRDG